MVFLSVYDLYCSSVLQVFRAGKFSEKALDILAFRLISRSSELAIISHIYKRRETILTFEFQRFQVMHID